MPIAEKSDEVLRLLRAFEAEASKFHAITFGLEYLTPESSGFSRPIATKHHGILLWQLFGLLENEADTERITEAIFSSGLKWGIPGAQFTCLGLIEGEQFDLFVRMAARAGSLFDAQEANEIKLRFTTEIVEAERRRHPDAKVVTTTNSNPVAVWLNYLLYHLSQSNPGAERSRRIEPDPFSLSLLALERLHSSGGFGKMDAAVKRLTDIRFRVALSFPGTQRAYVAAVAGQLRTSLGIDAVFYDEDYKAQLARPNMDVLLQNVYRHQSDLLVVFVCEAYSEREWCGLEWRAVRDLIKSKADDQVMLVRFDDALLEGIFSIDGYLDARTTPPSEIAAQILQRLSIT